MHKPQPPDKYSRSGVYKLTCQECNKAYVGQTAVASTRGSKNTEMRSNPIETHPNTPNTLKITNTHSAPYKKQCKFYNIKGKEPTSTPWKDFFIYKEYLINNHLSDEFNINPNKIFEAVLKSKEQ